MRKGFTLIELLLVVVIIGIVASLVLPKFGDVKEKAYVSAQKNDLRNAAVQQELYQDANSTYAPDVASLNSGTGFTTSQDVSMTFGSVTQTGYSAHTTHAKTAKTCAVLFTGTTNVGKITCS